MRLPGRDAQNIRRSQMAMHKTAAVNVVERIQNQLEHFARFIWCERPLPKKFSQIIFGVLHNQVQQCGAG